MSKAFVESGIPICRVAAIDGNQLTLPCADFDEKKFRRRHGRGTNIYEVACYLSHLKAMQLFLESNDEVAMICEDDLFLKPESKEILEKALASSASWNILRLTGLSEGKTYRIQQLSPSYFLTLHLGRLKGAGAYLIDRKAASILVQELLPMWLPWDHAIDREWNFDLKALAIAPFPISQTDEKFESAIQKASQAKAFLYVDDNFDGWSKSLNSKNTIEVFSLLPLAFVKNFTTPSMGEDMHIHSPNDGHNHEKGSPDPHFWMDPIAVKALLPVLADTLGKIDPDNASLYKTNADIFAKKIDVLSRQVEDLARNLRGKQVFLYHPSILYMLNRYEMIYAGSIEEIPGKEPSAKFIANLVEKIKKSQTKAIFSEPQLPDKNAKILAQETGVSLYILDPVGGTNNISKYSDLILYNIKILKKALE